MGVGPIAAAMLHTAAPRAADGTASWSASDADDLQRRVEGAAATIPDRDTDAGEIEAEGVPYRFLYSMQGLGLG